MKSLVVCLGLAAGNVLVATDALAQPAVQPLPARAKLVSANKLVPVGSTTVLAAARATAVATAPADPAGSAVVALSNGPVAQPGAVWIHPPADGFEYER